MQDQTPKNQKTLETNLKDILSKYLFVKELTEFSLKKALASRIINMPDTDKRQMNRQIAYSIIKAANSSINNAHAENLKTETSVNFKKAKVLAINHAGPLDITIEWTKGNDHILELSGYRIDSGGDQINVAKVFGNFKENIALVALAGKEEGEITREWEKNFLTEYTVPSLIHLQDEDQPVAVYNKINDETLPGIFDWQDELHEKTVKEINLKTLEILDRMLEHDDPENIWMVFSAGGPIKYNSALAYYSSLIKQVKEKYGSTIKMLIDFKFMSGPEEALSVLDIPRENPQDIIKPNLEEFIQLLTISGLAKKGTLDKTTISEKHIRSYACLLREKYNLLGVLVSMDSSGVMLVMRDRIIKENGIKITPACHIAAGDSLKAGFIYALSKGRSFEEAVHIGNLFGASTAAMEGSLTVTPKMLSKTETLARTQKVSPEIEYLA